MLPESVWPVSVNDHVAEPRDLWTKRLAARDAARGPRVVEYKSGEHEGGEAWQLGQKSFSIARYLPSVLMRADPQVKATRYAQLAPLSWDAKARVAAMDAEQVAVNTVLPQAIGFAGERLRFLEDGKLWAESVRAYNDWLLEEFCAAAPSRLAGIALVQLADPVAAVAEIGRVAKLGARGVSFSHDPGQLGLPSYHHPEHWQPIFDAADSAGLPIFIHLATAGFSAPPPGDPAWRPDAAQVMWSFLEPAWAACDLVFSPLLTERPQRKIVLLEGNLAWLPYFEERCDFSVNRRPDLQPKRATSTVAHEQLLSSFLIDPVAIRMRHEIGIERFLWQGDYPHIDSLWPDSRKELVRQLADIPDAEAIQIAEGNARKLLRMPRQ